MITTLSHRYFRSTVPLLLLLAALASCGESGLDTNLPDPTVDEEDTTPTNGGELDDGGEKEGEDLNDEDPRDGGNVDGDDPGDGEDIDDDDRAGGGDQTGDEDADDDDRGDGGEGEGEGGGEGDGGDAALQPPDWFDPQTPLIPGAHDEWRYVPVEGAVCANGKQSGFFINFSETSDDLLIFLLGGGICYDDASCALHLGLVNDGMGDDPFAWWMSNGERTNGVFRRDNPENPFKDASYVVLPHCTVDFHSANKESTYPSTGTIQQRGYRNVQLAMNHVVPTFADPNRNVTIAGFSAGGVGTLANYHQMASAFEYYGHLPPFLINDGGPVQTRHYFSLNSHNAIRNGWNLQDTIDTWCETCGENGYHEALYWIHQLHPGVRSSQICAYGDGVVMMLYGLFDVGNTFRFQVDGIPTPPFTYTHMKPGLDAFREWSEGFETEGMHRNLLYHRGDRHGALSVVPIDEHQTPAIVPFLRAQMNRDDPHWFSPHF